MSNLFITPASTVILGPTFLVSGIFFIPLHTRNFKNLTFNLFTVSARLRSIKYNSYTANEDEILRDEDERLSVYNSN